MAKSRRRPPSSSAAPKAGTRRGATAASKAGATPAPKATPRPARSTEPAIASAPFRLGAVPGATPGTWIDRWQQRQPHPLQLVPLAVDGQRDALLDGSVDAAIVRLPIDRDGLHVIPLYDEIPVVAVSIDSHLTAADELELADLAGEVLIVPADDVLRMPAPAGTVRPAFDAPPTTEDAVAIVAAGVGVVIVPMSLARLHHRRDVAHRPLRDGPVSPVALAWVADRTTADVEAFVGIVRGRTENSSR